METAKLKIKSLVNLTLDKLQDDLNTDVLRAQLNLLYLNKIYDTEAAEFRKIFDSALENVIHIIDDYKKKITMSLEGSIEELENKIKTQKSLII